VPSLSSLAAALHLSAHGTQRSARATPRRRAALRRLLRSGCVALVALASTLLAGESWSIAVASAWVAAALVFLVSVWAVVFSMDARATARAARAEDASRAATDTVLIGAALASLISVGFVLVDAAGSSGIAKGALTALAIGSVAAAWAAVHTVFMLRYASLYYADPIGGIDFNADDQPDYRDLAYVALTIGMTFQVSDTDLTTKSIRRTAVKHALLSYLFGAVIVAIMINIVGSLASTK
jgi:uncharacterized membrane protein